MGHVNKVSHVFILSHVAEMLGEDEEWLFEVAEEMDTEDGQLWVVGVGGVWLLNCFACASLSSALKTSTWKGLS